MISSLQRAGFGLAALGATLCVVPGAAAQSAPAWPAATAAECAVFAREASFAASVERGDAKAFAEHLHPGAVFLGGAVPARGRDGVAAAWDRIIRSDGVRLRWRAGTVVIGTNPDIAYSTGPSYFEPLGPVETGKTRPRYSLNSYFSVWVRDSDGAWRVMYDGGAVIRATDDFAEVERHLQSGRTVCR